MHGNDIGLSTKSGGVRSPKATSMAIRHISMPFSTTPMRDTRSWSYTAQPLKGTLPKQRYAAMMTCLLLCTTNSSFRHLGVCPTQKDGGYFPMQVTFQKIRCSTESSFSLIEPTRKHLARR